MPLVADLARSSGATVRLLNVRPVQRTQFGEYGRVVAYADQEMASEEAHGLAYLGGVEARLDRVPAERVVRFGKPVEEILLEAEAFGADVIALATAHRGRLERLLLGGVAEQVFRRASVPVLLVGTRAA